MRVTTELYVWVGGIELKEVKSLIKESDEGS